MPLPIAPIAGLALRYGALAMTSYALARRIERGRRDQRAEDALDGLDEGASLRRDGDDTHVTGRFRRVVRFGADGPGVEVDAAGFGRIRLKRV